MSEAKNAIENLAYTELLITCELNGCSNVFQPTLSEPATDPVEKWAENMADRALQEGWSADEAGRVLCPTHSRFNRI